MKNNMTHTNKYIYIYIYISLNKVNIISIYFINVNNFILLTKDLYPQIT